MEKGTKDLSLTIKEKDMVCSNGKMVGYMMACGKTVSSMELACSIARIIKLDKANGIMVRKSDGYKNNELITHQLLENNKM